MWHHIRKTRLVEAKYMLLAIGDALVGYVRRSPIGVLEVYSAERTAEWAAMVDAATVTKAS